MATIECKICKSNEMCVIQIREYTKRNCIHCIKCIEAGPFSCICHLRGFSLLLLFFLYFNIVTYFACLPAIWWSFHIKNTMLIFNTTNWTQLNDRLIVTASDCLVCFQFVKWTHRLDCSFDSILRLECTIFLHEK